MLNALAAALLSLESTQDSVAALVKDWKQKYLATAKLSDDTRKTYGGIADQVAHSLGQFKADAVDTPAIEEFLDFWNDRPRMRNEVRKVARQVFDWGVRRGRLRVNPADKAEKASLQRRSVYIPDDALAEVLGAMEREGGQRATHNGLMNRAFVELSYLTGQRGKDIRELKWSDLEQERMPFQPTKTEGSSGKRVAFTITPEIQRVLDSVLEFVQDRNDALIRRAAEEAEKRRLGKRSKAVPAPVESEYVIHRLDGKLFQQTGVRTAWRRALALTKYKDSGYTLKDIRPKTLTDIHRATDDLKEVQKFAAHASITTTEGYMRDKVTPTVVSPLSVPTKKSP
ncbi:tyrosine-type recombinase/integrase [Scleromatobacter humisilvae]|uniref:Tyrosine-type recombinase/integrase n=1 Tax=Scleromatobacter humisilvae TaxID=2897159 RepID=A0A9X1YKF6_9BURK|nr:tyrosine-type recombinase/integrase [Scleromatobacter humisilvae]MCK9687357.1 tyrosine-type recombinase/integrase [Scleromatobacter humisilvae]